MSSKFKTIQNGPIIDSEPNLLHDIPQDKFMSALVSLAAELYMVRDRVHVLEAELEKNNILPPDAVNKHEETSEENEKRSLDAQEFANRFWMQFADSDEPVSKIDPRVSKYL